MHGSKSFKHFVKSKHNGEWLFFTNNEWAHILWDSFNMHSRKSTRSNVSFVLGASIILQLIILLCGDIEMNPGPRDWSDISICHSNIRSIRSNTEKLKHISCALAGRYDIITLSETWLNSKCSNNALHLSGYQDPIRKDREDDTGYGGVLVWVSDSIAAKRRKEFEVPNLEALWLEIRTKNNKFLLCTIYRPPNTWYKFWDLFQESVNLAKESNIHYLVLAGDLNADPNSAPGLRLQEFIEANNRSSY